MRRRPTRLGVQHQPAARPAQGRRPRISIAAYPGSADQKNGLYLFQCGNTVADVNKVLESKSQQRSLFTSGAANGQTIVGATSCGTHGSALDFGALHDHIVAIHLIATGNSHFWIERKSRPVMKADWVEQARRHAEARRRRSVQRRRRLVRQLRHHRRGRARDGAALSAGDASPAPPSSTRICGR